MSLSPDLALTLDLLTPNTQRPATGQRLLRFPLSFQDSALLPLEQMTEILEVDAINILSVPEMPDCILGICNWRGEMLWLIDLPALVGYAPLFHSLQEAWRSPIIMVIQVKDQFLGLAVQQVYDIELHDLQQLQPPIPGLFPSRLLSFISGTLPGESGVVLDITSIVDCSLWQHHRERIA